MADQKITELTELATTPDDADILPIVDDVAGTPVTKKITVANLKAASAGDVGGLYGINVETLAANKTLTVDSNKIYQYLDEGGANRTITLATAGASAGDRFVIRHNGDYNDTHILYIKQSVTELDRIYAGGIKKYIFDGTNWIGAEIGTGFNDNKGVMVTLGYQSRAYGYRGIAIGQGAQAIGYESVAVGSFAKAEGNYTTALGQGSEAWDNYSVAIGSNSDAYEKAFAGGHAAIADDYGVVIGAYGKNNSKKYSVALGYYSEAERTSEIAHCIDGSTTQDYNFSSAGWAIQTANATPVEMFLGETANQRFTINPESVVSFVIRIAARDNVANEVANYKIEGLIKRDGSNNTVLSWSSKTVQYEDDASWDVAVTADDTNEALIITVTGDATNPVRWAARIDEVETQF